jgi:tetratricopeptide (TPR) repeat protein
LNKLSATNPEAYQLYLKGRYHANQTTAAELKKSIEYFQQSIDKDPGYGLAYAALADSYASLGGDWAYLSPVDTFPKAKAAAQKALELDETLGEAHAALAYAGYYADWDWPMAEREFRRAIELNPNSALSHDRYAECLKMRQRLSESMAEALKAQELDPLSPEIVSQVGSVYFFMRRYDDAIAQYQKALELNTSLAGVRAFLAWSYAMKHEYAKALTEYEKIADQDKSVAPENQIVASGLGWIYAVSGRRADALKIANEFRDLSSRSYVDFYFLAGIYAGLNDKDETFRLLQKGYEEHSAGMLYLAIDVFWDGLRSDPRYADLLRRMGLPQ